MKDDTTTVHRKQLSDVGFSSAFILALIILLMPSCRRPIPSTDCVLQEKGVKWVFYPDGSYNMGSEYGWSYAWPVVNVKVRSFKMTRTEITNVQYSKCVKAGKCRQNVLIKGFEGHYQPVVGVSWSDSRQFCNWIGGKLPSEAEWEYAARSGRRAYRYPWGNALPDCSRAIIGRGGDYRVDGCGVGRTWAVCSRLAGSTAQGLCDMVGNAEEWLEDCWNNSYLGTNRDGSARKCKGLDKRRSTRGGSWSTFPINANPGNRTMRDMRDRGQTGFRCASEIENNGNDNSRDLVINWITIGPWS